MLCFICTGKNLTPNSSSPNSSSIQLKYHQKKKIKVSSWSKPQFLVSLIRITGRWLWWASHGWLCQVPPKLLTLFLLNREEKIRWKNSLVSELKIKRRLFISCPHMQNRLNLCKTNRAGQWVIKKIKAPFLQTHCLPGSTSLLCFWLVCIPLLHWPWCLEDFFLSHIFSSLLSQLLCSYFFFLTLP